MVSLADAQERAEQQAQPLHHHGDGGHRAQQARVEPQAPHEEAPGPDAAEGDEGRAAQGGAEGGEGGGGRVDAAGEGALGRAAALVAVRGPVRARARRRAVARRHVGHVRRAAVARLQRNVRRAAARARLRTCIEDITSSFGHQSVNGGQ